MLGKELIDLIKKYGLENAEIEQGGTDDIGIFIVYLNDEETEELDYWVGFDGVSKIELITWTTLDNGDSEIDESYEVTEEEAKELRAKSE